MSKPIITRIKKEITYFINFNIKQKQKKEYKKWHLIYKKLLQNLFFKINFSFIKLFNIFVATILKRHPYIENPAMINSTKNRKSHIMRELNKNKRVDVLELSQFFNVSEVTIRKDLIDLASRNLLIRVRGGAIMMPNVASDYDIDDNITDKIRYHNKEKQSIGKLAASLISEKETILLDSGTTTLEIAKHLDTFQELTIITNAINIAAEVAKYNRFNIILLGGFLRNKSLSTVGSIAESTLKIFYCDKLFLGVDSFSIDNGLSTTNIEEANINQAMISMAKETIAVLDSSKFNKRNFAYIAPVSAIGTIVTDSNISEDIQKQLVALGINIHIAK